MRCHSELTVHGGWEIKPWGLNISFLLKTFQQGSCIQCLSWWTGLFLRKHSLKLLHAEEGLRSKLYSGSLLVSELLRIPSVKREVEFKITCLCCLPLISYFPQSLMENRAHPMQQSPEHKPSLCSHTASEQAGFKQPSVLVLHIWAHHTSLKSIYP